MEIETQVDGQTVGLKEASIGFVKGKIAKSYPGSEAGEEIMVKAEDYTSSGDNEEIEVMIGGNKKTKILKKHIVEVLIEGIQELNEVGVYNSQTDTNANPKTGENIPDEMTGFLSKLTDSIQNMVADLTEIKETVKEHSKISYDSLDVCIAELNSYVKSIQDEELVSSSATPN